MAQSVGKYRGNHAGLLSVWYSGNRPDSNNVQIMCSCSVCLRRQGHIPPMADLGSGWQAVSGCCLCGAALLQRRLGALGRRCSLLLLDLPCCSLALARQLASAVSSGLC